MTKIFADGFIFKRPLPQTPKWVKGNISIKVEPFVAFLKKYEQDGWVNISLNESQDGSKLYGALNDYKKGEQRSAEATEAKEEPADTATPPDEIIASDIPF